MVNIRVTWFENTINCTLISRNWLLSVVLLVSSGWCTIELKDYKFEINFDSNQGRNVSLLLRSYFIDEYASSRLKTSVNRVHRKLIIHYHCKVHWSFLKFVYSFLHFCLFHFFNALFSARPRTFLNENGYTVPGSLAKTSLRRNVLSSKSLHYSAAFRCITQSNCLETEIHLTCIYGYMLKRFVCYNGVKISVLWTAVYIFFLLKEALMHMHTFFPLFLQNVKQFVQEKHIQTELQILKWTYFSNWV